MTGRSVPEWQGATPDSRPPTRVRLRVFERYQGKCYLTGRKIRAGEPWDLEHIKPLHAGGLNVESNLAPASKEAHREKSAAEVSAKAKADRTRAKHLGIYPASPFKIRSRGFPKRTPSPKRAEVLG